MTHPLSGAPRDRNAPGTRRRRDGVHRTRLAVLTDVADMEWDYLARYAGRNSAGVLWDDVRVRGGCGRTAVAWTRFPHALSTLWNSCDERERRGRGWQSGAHLVPDLARVFEPRRASGLVLVLAGRGRSGAADVRDGTTRQGRAASVIGADAGCGRLACVWTRVCGAVSVRRHAIPALCGCLGCG